MAVVEVRGLTYKYGSRPALRDLSLDVPEGAIYAVLGPNGSGKTTLASGKATVHLRVSSVPNGTDATNAFSPALEEMEFALLNESRHETVRLFIRGGSNVGGWLVLPGIQVSNSEQTLENQL